MANNDQASIPQDYDCLVFSERQFFYIRSNWLNELVDRITHLYIKEFVDILHPHPAPNRRSLNFRFAVRKAVGSRSADADVRAIIAIDGVIAGPPYDTIIAAQPINGVVT